jgi:hypothetical protein
MKKDMERQQINSLSEKMAKELSSFDRRHLFMKLYMPRIVTRVILEGTADHCCSDMVDMVTKYGNYDELKEGLEKLFPGEDFSYVKK